jgi:hypothetical protein
MTFWKLSWGIIKKLEPDATVLKGLPVEMSTAESRPKAQVKAWLESLG